MNNRLMKNRLKGVGERLGEIALGAARNVANATSFAFASHYAKKIIDGIEASSSRKKKKKPAPPKDESSDSTPTTPPTASPPTPEFADDE